MLSFLFFTSLIISYTQSLQKIKLRQWEERSGAFLTPVFTECLSNSLHATKGERAKVDWSCVNSVDYPNQSFDFVGGLIKSQTGLCLDVKGGEYYWDGTAPSCRGGCGDNYRLKWDSCGDGSCCWSGDKALCSRDRYLPLIWWDCHGGFNQKFILEKGYLLRYWNFEGKDREVRVVDGPGDGTGYWAAIDLDA
eukprot:CAMPEP_0201587508 /NCGR_PEP_ID=MMETSP0190_2-20130828/144497_1 /ASSEMBLY_ACC=CAM_ASM_000263 /TAXON_ID=37353 /ORGANISM="Rosalina sp." /LENGTH=192 /DNA_ID=CAMNT_0048037695 /DNA_START=111 /DNA_END=689 /DNA_ORIENTATION=-